MTQRVLILGAGFSAALSDEMPTIARLADYFQRLTDYPELANLRKSPYSDFMDPRRPELFELLLTYLSQEQPWKAKAHALRDRAIFENISGHLGEYLASCEDRAFQSVARREAANGAIPKWLRDLTAWLLKTRTPVITFNYDTVLERALLWTPLNGGRNDASHIDKSVYGLSLTPLVTPEGKPLSEAASSMFHLVKLHGSINWFYSGVGGFPGEDVHYYPIQKQLSPVECYQEATKLAKGKVPLIIPPILDKRSFYGHHLVRSLWSDARYYLEQADEIFCVGYSMPLTDLTTRLLFLSVSRFPGKTVYIVNLSHDSQEDEELKKRYKAAFAKQEIDPRLLLPSSYCPVQKMVEFLSEKASQE